MKSKAYTTQELVRDKSVVRKITIEARLHNNGEKELFFQLFDKGEYDKEISCLVEDVIEMKKLRQVLNFVIGDRT